MGAHSPSSQRQPEDRHYTQLRASPGYGPRYTASRGYGPRYTAYLYLLFIYFYLIFILVLVSCLGSFSHSLSLYLWPLNSLFLSLFPLSIFRCPPLSRSFFFSSALSDGRFRSLSLSLPLSLCLYSPGCLVEDRAAANYSRCGRTDKGNPTLTSSANSTLTKPSP